MAHVPQRVVIFNRNISYNIYLKENDVLPNTKLLIIDGPPDVDEDKKGVPFVSNKGLLFEKMLNAIELKLDETFIIKSIPWRPSKLTAYSHIIIGVNTV